LTLRLLEVRLIRNDPIHASRRLGIEYPDPYARNKPANLSSSRSGAVREVKIDNVTSRRVPISKALIQTLKE
jgi:hypothetical protein